MGAIGLRCNRKTERRMTKRKYVGAYKSNNWLGLKLFANVAWDVKLCGVVELLPTRSRHNAFKNTTCRPKRISGETSHLSVQTNHQFIIMKPYYLFLSCILTALLPFTCTQTLCAENLTLYVSGKSRQGNGSQQSPYATLAQATQKPPERTKSDSWGRTG